MTNRTPLEKFEIAKLDALEEVVADAEKTYRVETDPTLSPDQRLEILKGLQAWPRIVLGLYRSELAAAQKRKKENPDPEHGEPSDRAYDKVGSAIGLKGDRVKALCLEGGRHLKQRMPQKPKISATEFTRKVLRGRVKPRKRKKPQAAK